MAQYSLSLLSSSYRAQCRQAVHSHDELQITIVLRGAVAERVGSAVEYASALSVVVKDPGVRHADDFGPAGALTAQLKVHDTALADLVEHPNRGLAWRWAHDARVAVPFLHIVRRGLDGDLHFRDDDDDIVDLIAAVSSRVRTSTDAGVPAWLDAAVTRIREEWRPGLTVRDIARACGVHPVYFARCVRRWFGVAAADLLRRSRLRHAARRIADGDTTIATVAHAAGFSDESHLNREFSHVAGMSPARFRRLTRAVASNGVGR